MGFLFPYLLFYHLLEKNSRTVIIEIMKKGIHPKYYPDAKVKCACGAEFEVGSTKPYMEIEICSRCHPVYTGKEKIVETVSEVKKFKERLKKMRK
jgi:large subunit ribosomal protein L31